MPRLNRELNFGMVLISVGALSLGTAAVGQQSMPPAPSQYQGVSQPPGDAILTSPEQASAPAKPSPAVLAAPAPQVPPSAATDSSYVGDNGQPALDARRPNERPDVLSVNDPDGDIVHPRVAQPGELLEGATIRVKLIERLSSAETEKGEPFHGQVAFDVLQDGKVLIPAGSGLEGRVSAVSSGHFGGHGSMRLHPEAVILPDGSRFQLHAETTGTRGSKTRMGSEGSINPPSRAKKAGIEYGAVVGTGAVAGAIVGGPVGALTGSLIGAGVVTTHLLVDHPQATLEPGTVLLFSLTEPMFLAPASN
jgi:hypothetical protein